MVEGCWSWCARCQRNRLLENDGQSQCWSWFHLRTLQGTESYNETGFCLERHCSFAFKV